MERKRPMQTKDNPSTQHREWISVGHRLRFYYRDKRGKLVTTDMLFNQIRGLSRPQKTHT